MSYFESACTNHIKQQIDFDSSPLIRHSSRQSSVTTLSHVVDIYKPSPVQCSQHSSQEFVSERQALLDSLGKVAAKEKQPSFEVHRFHSFPNHISRDRFGAGSGSREEDSKTNGSKVHTNQRQKEVEDATLCQYWPLARLRRETLRRRVFFVRN